MMVDCPSCGGSGGGDERHLRCRTCLGTGQIDNEMFADDYDEPDDDEENDDC